MTDPSPDSITPEPARPRLSAESLSRIAEQVANQDIDLPEGLNPDQEQALIDLVRSRVRDRLVRHIARAIAQDLLRDRRITNMIKDNNNDQD